MAGLYGANDFNIVCYTSGVPLALTVSGATSVVTMPAGTSTDGTARIGRYTVATLPTPGTTARCAFASNGRKLGQAAGAGTGVPVWDDGAAWRTYDGTTVTA